MNKNDKCVQKKVNISVIEDDMLQIGVKLSMTNTLINILAEYVLNVEQFSDADKANILFILQDNFLDLKNMFEDFEN